MKNRLLNLALIATSMLGYLEWGGGNAMFLFQGEYEILRKLFADPTSVVHPFVLLPLFGQIILLVTLFQKPPRKWLTYLGIACLGLLLGFMCLIGLVSLNLKVFVSTLPFIVTAIFTVINFRSRTS